MFKSLKQKIKQETGQNVEDLAFNNNNNSSSRLNLVASQSVSLDDNTIIEDVSLNFECMTNMKKFISYAERS